MSEFSESYHLRIERADDAVELLRNSDSTEVDVLAEPRLPTVS